MTPPLPAGYRPHAPGAVLDGEPWAQTWPSFLRAISNTDDSGPRTFIKNAMGERVPSEGGFLVPERLRADVLSYMTAPVVRPRSRMVLPMDTLRLPVPTLDNPSQASGAQALGGLTFSFTEPGQTITATTPTFGQTVLEARKLAAYLANVPNELADDAVAAFSVFLSQTIAEGLAWVEDDFFIGTAGTGVGCPQSLLNAPAAVTVSRTGSPVALADVAKMVNSLAPASLQAGLTPGITDVAWLMSASLFTALLEMYLLIGTTPTSAAAAGIPWISLGDGGQVGPSMLGLPLVVTDHQPAAGTAGDLILADLRHYAIGDRLTMTVERSGQGAGFVTDTSNFRIRSRVDGRYWIQSATTTEANQSVSPVVVLH